jgi:competence ComEA-like helix-hairpin-helix protein
MAEGSSTSPTPPTPRQALIARAEQALLVFLALGLVAGVAWRAVSYWRIGQEPLEVVAPSGGPSYRVNVNTAEWTELSLVPGLGPKLSQRIVERRDMLPDRRFQSLDDLRGVKGIGDKVLAKLKPFLTLDNSGTESIQMPSDRPAAP